MYVEYGKDPSGNSILYRVPVRYADTNRQVSSILKNNSDVSLLNVPMMVCYITKVDYDRGRMQEPKFVDNRSIRTRATDPLTGNTNTQQGQNYQLKRLMPAPYKLTVNMEMWTSNFDQKLQLFEQIGCLFNPDMEIQNTDNYLDWTSLSYILLSNFNWTSRDIPVGADDPIDVSTFTFEMPIWLSTPAKIQRLGIVQSVVSNIYDANGNASTALIEAVNNLGNRQYFTPTGYQVLVNNGNVKLFPRGGPEIYSNSYTMPTTTANSIAWSPVINLFGNIANNYSMMYLTDSRTERLITGTVAYDPNNQYNLFFNVDSATIPTNILPSVNAIVDPRVNGPGVGLPNAAVGQRYLIVNNNIGNASTGNAQVSWKNANNSITNAQPNDIVQYNGNAWAISYHPTANSNASYVTNTFSGLQYAWDGSQWVKSWEGIYQEGLWSIVI
jgi:hypothetical protein